MARHYSPCPETSVESHALDTQLSMTLAERAVAVHTRLLNLFGEPTWHNPLPPVDELVSTILSQNTNDINRDRAFNTLCKRFPTWEAVRDAEPYLVIDAIRQAGLANLKGPRIQAVLREITDQRGSIDLEFLKRTCRRVKRVPGSPNSKVSGLKPRPLCSCFHWESQRFRLTLISTG